MAGRVLGFITDGDEGDPVDSDVVGEDGVFEYEMGVMLRDDGWMDGE